MRAAAAVLTGFALISIWSIAFISNNAGWLAWIDGGAGMVAVIAAFGLVRDSRAARAALALDATVLLTGSLIGFVYNTASVWLTWSSLGLACGLTLMILPRRLVARGSIHLRTP